MRRSRTKKIGILGYGTIGKFIFGELKYDKDIEVVFVYDPCIETPVELIDIHVKEINEEIVKTADLIVEVAAAQVLHQFYEIILTHTNFLAFSSTALANELVEKNIKKISEEHNTIFYIPHGAVLGLDGIFDGRSLLNSVEIITTKKPKGFSVDYTDKTILYEGDTRGACIAYPKNVNVHAAIALAGLGMDKTYSKIISDPDISGNTHHIVVKGDGIDFSINIESKPLGQVTGVYTPKSALASILKILKADQGIKFV